MSLIDCICYQKRNKCSWVLVVWWLTRLEPEEIENVITARAESEYLGKVFQAKINWTMLSVSLHNITDWLFCGANRRSFFVQAVFKKCMKIYVFSVFSFSFFKKFLKNSRTDLKCLIRADCIPEASCSFMPSWSGFHPADANDFFHLWSFLGKKSQTHLIFWNILMG